MLNNVTGYPPPSDSPLRAGTQPALQQLHHFTLVFEDEVIYQTRDESMLSYICMFVHNHCEKMNFKFKQSVIKLSKGCM